MKKWILVLVLAAAPARAQSNLSGEVIAERLKYGPIMTAAQVGDLLNAVAWRHKEEGWGLLQKLDGSRCPSPQGTFIACDILFHQPSAHHFDVLSFDDDSGNIIARPSGWNDVGPMDPFRFVAPVPPVILTPNPGTTTGNPPPPTTIPSVNLNELYVRLAQLEEHFDGRIDTKDQKDEVRYLDLSKQNKALADGQESLRADINSPSWFREIMGNRYVQMGLAVAGGFIANWQLRGNNTAQPAPAK